MNETIKSHNNHIVCLIKYRLNTAQQCHVNGLLNGVHLTMVLISQRDYSVHVVCVSVCLSVCLYVCMSVCLSVYLWLFPQS